LQSRSQQACARSQFWRRRHVRKTLTNQYFSDQTAAIRNGTAMNTQSCTPYRGFNVDVNVITSNVISLDGQEVRYSVFWSITSTEPTATSIDSFPEQLGFLSWDSAFSYGERRAHAFIDSLISTANDG
jgi:hypothetical protein